jgi:hypothetical protein
VNPISRDATARIPSALELVVEAAVTRQRYGAPHAGAS